MLMQYKVLAILTMVIVLLGSAVSYHHHVFEQGVTKESNRRDIIDATNKANAEKELAQINGHVKEVQSELDKFTESLSIKQRELDHEKQISSDYQVRLAAGTDRLRVLTIAHNSNQARPASDPKSTIVDSGTETSQDLAPIVAIGLERIRINENAAIDRLDACIDSYDKIKTSFNSIK